MSDSSSQRLQARRVVEALRAGVPSAAAVSTLGTGQSELEGRYRAALDDVQRLAGQDEQAAGFLVRGGFGAGKSHLLTIFEHIALAEGFAVSRIVISKETPLHDPVKLLASAAEAMRSPDELDRGVEPIARRLLRRRDDPMLLALEQRLESPGGLNLRFAATLFIYTRGSSDQELADRVVRFWSGDVFGPGDIRRAARELDRAGAYTLEPIKKRDLALQTLSFLPHLVRAAGLRGWILLIDEVELIGRYSRLQRGRSYAELARWLGVVSSDGRPGLLAVAAVSDDFDSEVLRGGRTADLDDMAVYLAGRGEDETAAAAQAGMRLIRESELLASPADPLLQRTYGTLRSLHGAAYDWAPPDVAWPEALGTTPMRKYVRAWINAWDVRRLYPGFVEGDNPYEMSEPVTDYAEDEALAPPDGTPDDDGRREDDW